MEQNYSFKSYTRWGKIIIFLTPPVGKTIYRFDSPCGRIKPRIWHYIIKVYMYILILVVAFGLCMLMTYRQVMDSIKPIKAKKEYLEL